MEQLARSAALAPTITDRPLPFLPAAFWIGWFSFREMVRRRRLVFLGLVMLAPSLLCLVWRLRPEHVVVPADLFMANLGGLIYVHVMVAIVSLAVGISAISEQVDEGTILYYWTRPLSRGAIYMGRLVAAQAVAAIMLLFSLVICFLVMVLGNLGILSLDFLKLYAGNCLIIVVGALVYTAIFALAGTALRRPILPAVLFALGWESISSTVAPLRLQELTVAFHLRNLIQNPNAGTRSIPNLLMELMHAMLKEAPLPAWRSAVSLLGTLAVATLLGIWLLRRKEIFK